MVGNFETCRLFGRSFNWTLVRSGFGAGFVFGQWTLHNCRNKHKILEKGTFIFCAKLWCAPNSGSKRFELWSCEVTRAWETPPNTSLHKSIWTKSIKHRNRTSPLHSVANGPVASQTAMGTLWSSKYHKKNRNRQCLSIVSKNRKDYDWGLRSFAPIILPASENRHLPLALSQTLCTSLGFCVFHFPLSLSLSRPLSLSLSILSVCLSLSCPSVCLGLSRSVYLSVCLSVSLSLSLCLSPLSLSLSLSLSLYIYIYISLSLSLPLCAFRAVQHKCPCSRRQCIWVKGLEARTLCVIKLGLQLLQTQYC